MTTTTVTARDLPTDQLLAMRLARWEGDDLVFACEPDAVIRVARPTARRVFAPTDAANTATNTERLAAASANDMTRGQLAKLMREARTR